MRVFRICLLMGSMVLPILFFAQQTSEESTAASRIEEIMQARYVMGDFNGTVLVARQGRVIYERGFGLANREWNIANNLQTKFEIGSMTKQFTAMLILQFVNDGKIRLDGCVSEYLSYYRQDIGKRITISELLSHTSGVPSFTSIPGFLDGPASRARYGVQEFVQKYCSGDLGETYEGLLQDRIFEPLGMKSSGYTHSETVIAHRAAGYERSAVGLQNARYYDMSIPFAAGALYSTAEDLNLWDQALYSDRLLPARLRDLLFKPNLEDYGYGWGLLIPKAGSPYAGESIPMHGGAIFGFQSLIQRIVQHKELIVLLDNTDSSKLLEIASEIRRALADNH